MMYSLDEVGLLPAPISEIKHREDVDPFYRGNNIRDYRLPIFVAPMTCLVDRTNIEVFERNKVFPILPVRPGWKRMILPNKYLWEGWTALTLEEFKEQFINNIAPIWDYAGPISPKILIDVANGHMKELFDLVRLAKELYTHHLKVMIGNIANPETYIDCCKAGVDYVRVGIGGGSGCTTSVQTGIHASLPYLLEKIKFIKAQLDYDGSIPFRTKIVADGGIDTIGKAIKCLALGADYVMMGKVFAQCEDVAGIQGFKCSIPLNAKEVTKKEALYYGQSSAKGQIDRFGKVKSNPEGTECWVPITTTLGKFTEDFEAALRSAMSYCNARTLEDFIGKVRYEYMSPTEFNSFNK